MKRGVPKWASLEELRMFFSEMLDRGQSNAAAIVDSRGAVTYGEFRAAVAGFAARLHDMGLAKGERVALWGYNSANWLVAFFAIVRAGGVALLVNYSMGVDDAAELLRKANARFIVCGDNGQTKRRDDAMEVLADAVGVERARCIDVRGDACDLASAYAGAEVLDEHGSWAKIRIDVDGYEGYVDRKMISLLSDENYEAVISAPYAVVCYPVAMAVSNANQTTIILTAGSRLPNYSNGKFSLLGVEFSISPELVALNPEYSEANILRSLPYFFKSALRFSTSNFIPSKSNLLQIPSWPSFPLITPPAK